MTNPISYRVDSIFVVQLSDKNRRLIRYPSIHKIVIIDVQINRWPLRIIDSIWINRPDVNTFLGTGSEERVYIGAIDPNGINDTEGPAIDLYINDDNFVNGGITDESPILIAQLYDENGINTVGNGIGHDQSHFLPC